MVCLEVAALLQPALQAALADAGTPLSQDDLKRLAARAAVLGWDGDDLAAKVSGAAALVNGSRWTVKAVSVKDGGGTVTVTYVLNGTREDVVTVKAYAVVEVVLEKATGYSVCLISRHASSKADSAKRSERQSTSDTGKWKSTSEASAQQHKSSKHEHKHKRKHKHKAGRSGALVDIDDVVFDSSLWEKPSVEREEERSQSATTFSGASGSAGGEDKPRHGSHLVADSIDSLVEDFYEDYWDYGGQSSYSSEPDYGYSGGWSGWWSSGSSSSGSGGGSVPTADKPSGSYVNTDFLEVEDIWLSRGGGAVASRCVAAWLGEVWTPQWPWRRVVRSRSPRKLMIVRVHRGVRVLEYGGSGGGEVEGSAVSEEGVVAVYESLEEALAVARSLNETSTWQYVERDGRWVKVRRVYVVRETTKQVVKKVSVEETLTFSFALVSVSLNKLTLYNPSDRAVSVSLSLTALSTSKGSRLEITDHYGSFSKTLGPGEKIEVPLLCLGAARVHAVVSVTLGGRKLQVRVVVRRVTPPLLDALIELMEPIDWNTFWVELAWSLLPALGVGAAVTALLVCSPEVGSKVLVGLFLTSLLLIAVDVASRYTDFFYDVAVLGSWGAAAAKDPGRAACIALDVLLLFGAGVSLEDVRIALFEKGANPKVRARAWAHVIAAVVSAVVLGAVSMAAKRAVAQKFGEILTAELGPVLGEEAPEIKALVGLAEEVGVRKMKRVISECIPALRAAAESEEFSVLRSLLLKEFGAKIEFGDGVIKYVTGDAALEVRGDGLYLLLAREGGAVGRLKIGGWRASPLGKAVAVETEKGVYVLAKRAREFYEAMFRIAGEVGEEAFAALERVALGEGTEGAAALVARSMERLVEAGKGGAARRLAGLAARAYGEGRADVVERAAWAFDVLTRKKRIEEAVRVLSVAERAASEGVWELCGGLLERVARAAEAKRWKSIGRWAETVEAALADERFLRLARMGVVEFPEKGEYSVTASCGDLRVKVLGRELRVLVPEGESGGEVRYAARRLRELVFYENELGEWAVAVYEKAGREGARRSRAVYYLAERGYVWVKGGGPIGRASVALELGVGDEFRGVRVVGGYRVVVEFEPRSAAVGERSVEAEGVVRVKLVDAFGNVVSSRAVPARARPEGGGFVVDFEVGGGRLKIVSEPSGEGAVSFEYGLSVVRSIGERGGRRKVDTRRIGRAVLTFCGSESPRPCVVLLATDESGRVWGRTVALEGLTFRGVKAQLAHSNPSEVSKRICREIWGIIREYMKRTEETSWTSNEAREYLKNSGFKILEEEIPDELIDRSNYIGKIGEKYAREVYSIEVSKTGPDLVSDYYVYEIKSIDLVTCKDEKILEQRIINQIRSALKDEIIQWIRSEKYISKFWDRKWKPKRVIIVLIGVVADTENNVVAARILEEVEVTVTWALGEP